MKILWINEKATLKGGAEQYIFNTVKELNSLNINSSLLYNHLEETNDQFLDEFKEAFPILSLKEQIQDIKPDVIYIHQLDSYETYEQILQSNVPAIRFFHDHKLFCLREHKYTTIKQHTCTQKTGISCYSCLGFINRSDNVLGFTINSLNKIHKLQDINKKLKHFIVASSYMKEHLKLHEFDEDKITINPLYASKFFKFANYTNFTQNKILLFVGQLINGKGLDSLLKIMKNINKEYKLVVVGNGTQKEYLMNYAKELKVDERVEFVGSKSQEELQEYYKKSYCLIVPSRSPETFNLVGIEALKVGLPVIATDVGGISSWLRDDVTGLLVKPNDSKDLESKINTIIVDKTLHKRLTYGVYISSIYEHDSRAHADALIETFKKCIGA